MLATKWILKRCIPHSNPLSCTRLPIRLSSSDIDIRQYDKRSRPRWSQDEKAKLENLLLAGTPRKDIYAHFPKRSYQAVREYIRSKYGANFQPQKSFWSVEEDETVRSAKSSGHSWQHIKPRFPHRTRAAIIGRWKSLSQPPRLKHERSFLTQDDRCEIYRLRTDERLTYQRIAQRLGRSTSSIQSFLRRKRLKENDVTLALALASRSPPWTPPEDAELVRLKNAGFTDTTIATQLKRKESNVRFRLQCLRDDPSVGPISGVSPWTEDEDDRLLSIALSEQSADKSLRQLAKEASGQFPRRSLDQVRQRMAFLKTVASQWHAGAESDLSTPSPKRGGRSKNSGPFNSLLANIRL